MSESEEKTSLGDQFPFSEHTSSVSVKPEARSEGTESGSVDDEVIGIKVADSQTEVQFKVKRKTQLQRVIDSFCKRTGKDRNSLRFMFDGDRIENSDTPASLGMEDGDKIEAMNQQTGGFW